MVLIIFNSNSKKVLETLDENLFSQNVLEDTVLRMKWNTSLDSLSIAATNLEIDVPTTKLTKRFVLSTIAGLFDPAGLQCPM
jgi:hypothetical protein